MIEASWTFSIILGTLSLLICVKNAEVFIKREMLKRKAPSVIPFIGGIIGFFALRVCPLPAIGRWAWVALILDTGTIGQAYYLWLIIMGKRIEKG